MSNFKFICPHCAQQLEVSESDLGQKVECPACQGEIALAKPTPVLRVARMANAPHAIPQTNVTATSGDQDASPPPLPQPPNLPQTQRRPIRVQARRSTLPPPIPKHTTTAMPPLFLYIPLSRLIFMSFLSCGLFEVYWMYKNWWYIKERGDNRKISPPRRWWRYYDEGGNRIVPILRAWFGYFYCLPLFRRIHEDQEAQAYQIPSFSPGWLFTGWLLLSFLAYMLSGFNGTFILALFIPSFLFFVPVQRYVNTVCRKRNPEQAYYRWSSGHVVCLVFGLVVWGLVLLLVFSGIAALSGDKAHDANGTTPPAPSISEVPPGAPAAKPKSLGDELWGSAPQPEAAAVVAATPATAVAAQVPSAQKPVAVAAEYQTWAATAAETAAKERQRVAAERFRMAADLGNAAAMVELGDCYRDGTGVPKDEAEAVKWFCKAIALGYADAMCRLGSCYYRGKGVPLDYTKAVTWFRKAADLGNAGAMCDLGGCCCRGEGLPQNYTEAIKWFRKAAELGNATAMCSLGGCYAEGDGVPKSDIESIKWFRKAADLGNTTAMVELGDCYRDGEGAPKDSAEAASWYRKAADLGNTNASAHARQREDQQTAIQATIAAIVKAGVPDAAALLADPRFREFATDNPQYNGMLVADPNRAADIAFVMNRFREKIGMAKPVAKPADDRKPMPEGIYDFTRDDQKTR